MKNQKGITLIKLFIIIIIMLIIAAIFIFFLMNNAKNYNENTPTVENTEKVEEQPEEK